MAEVHDFPSGPPGGDPRRSGNGGSYDDRLRRVELAVERIDERMKHMATKEFIWRAILAGAALAAAATTAISRLIP